MAETFAHLLYLAASAVLILRSGRFREREVGMISITAQPVAARATGERELAQALSILAIGPTGTNWTDPNLAMPFLEQLRDAIYERRQVWMHYQGQTPRHCC